MKSNTKPNETRVKSIACQKESNSLLILVPNTSTSGPGFFQPYITLITVNEYYRQSHNDIIEALKASIYGMLKADLKQKPDTKKDTIRNEKIKSCVILHNLLRDSLDDNTHEFKPLEESQLDSAYRIINNYLEHFNYAYPASQIERLINETDLLSSDRGSVKEDIQMLIKNCYTADQDSTYNPHS